jgi:hypothetical protein
VDYGPRWKEGIIDREPPSVGKPFPTLLPQVDADGNETAGIRFPEIAVPLATYTGWNLRDPAIGAPHAMYALTGSMFPFARTRAEREKSGDPRPSVAERYRDEQEYLRRVEVAARELVAERFLLERDVPAVVAQARRRWERLVAAPVAGVK